MPTLSELKQRADDAMRYATVIQGVARAAGRDYVTAQLEYLKAAGHGESGEAAALCEWLKAKETIEVERWADTVPVTVDRG